MKWTSKDPTAADYDTVNLTREEWKRVCRECAICAAVLLIIIYLIAW